MKFLWTPASFSLYLQLLCSEHIENCSKCHVCNVKYLSQVDLYKSSGENENISVLVNIKKKKIIPLTRMWHFIILYYYLYLQKSKRIKIIISSEYSKNFENFEKKMLFLQEFPWKQIFPNERIFWRNFDFRIDLI